MARPAVTKRRVLILCTGNSARSVIAEAILNRAGQGKFRAYSAGSMPKGEVHPQTLGLLGRLGHETSGFRSKSWDEFAGTVSHDDGHTWSAPIDTGIQAESSNLLSLVGERLLSIHCHRGQRTFGKLLPGVFPNCAYGASGEAGAFQPVEDRHG